MFFRRTIRSILVALALTAGTAALCAIAPAEATVSPNLHIVAKGHSLQQKNTKGGFTSTLKASAVSLGRSLVKQLSHAMVKQLPSQNRLARRVARSSQHAAMVRPVQQLNAAHAAAGNDEILISSPVLSGCSVPAAHNCLHKTPVDPIVTRPGPIPLDAAKARIFCALHYYSRPLFAASVSQEILRRQPVTGRASRVNSGMQALTKGRSRIWPAQSHRRGSLVAAGGSSHWLHQGRPWVNTALKLAQPATIRFPIDPVKPTELLAHGAMGARNALRGDRSRDNRAQSV